LAQPVRPGHKLHSLKVQSLVKPFFVFSISAVGY
jgi:hypothetical protein